MKITLLRNATCIVEVSEECFLIDPLLGKKSSNKPIPWSANPKRNPMVRLPFSKKVVQQIIENTQAVILTHLHPDHWDKAAIDMIPKDKMLICQQEDIDGLTKSGFNNLHHSKNIVLETVKVSRVRAMHGKGELAKKMAPVSGYIISDKHNKVYITGDTVWCKEVLRNLNSYNPNIIIANGGAAKFTFGEPITMTINDIESLLINAKPEAKIIVVHLEAINHCGMTRNELKRHFKKEIKYNRLFIPEDGETINL